MREKFCERDLAQRVITTSTAAVYCTPPGLCLSRIAVERVWRIHNSQGQILVLTFRLNKMKLSVVASSQNIRCCLFDVPGRGVLERTRGRQRTRGQTPPPHLEGYLAHKKQPPPGTWQRTRGKTPPPRLHGTSRIRTSLSLRTYRSICCGSYGDPWGGGAFPMSEVHL